MQQTHSLVPPFWDRTDAGAPRAQANLSTLTKDARVLLQAGTEHPRPTQAQMPDQMPLVILWAFGSYTTRHQLRRWILSSFTDSAVTGRRLGLRTMIRNSFGRASGCRMRQILVVHVSSALVTRQKSVLVREGVSQISETSRRNYYLK